MSSRIPELLSSLYDQAGEEASAKRIAAAIANFPQPLGPSTRATVPTELTERDVLLIGYADQVREPDAPPLTTLGRFAHAVRLHDVVSGIHLLPFYPWSSDDGFAVKDLLSVAPEYGTWDDIARLGGEFDLMFDAVFNHLSAESEWFRHYLADDPAYRDFFVTVNGDPDMSAVVRPRALPLLTVFTTANGPRKIWTTFGPDQVDLNFHNPAVLLAIVEAILFYVRHGARFIRLDAIAFLWKEIGTSCLHLPQTHRIIQLLRAVLDEVAPAVRLITETNVPHQDNLSYFGDGANEAHLVYNFALPPLVLHAMQTGNAERLTRWAQSLALPSADTAFFNFLASHDGIGLNPARGILDDTEIAALVRRTQEHGGFISYKHLPDGTEAPYELNINFLDALSNPAAAEPPELAARKFLTAQAIMLCLHGMPGIYFHSLFGSRGDRAAAESSGIKRRINRAKLERAPLEAELQDPATLRSRVFEGHRVLLSFRRLHPAFSPTALQHALALDPRVFAVLRETADGHDRVLCLHNVSGEEALVRNAQTGPAGRKLAAWDHCWLPLR